MLLVLSDQFGTNLLTLGQLAHSLTQSLTDKLVEESTIHCTRIDPLYTLPVVRVGVQYSCAESEANLITVALAGRLTLF